MDNNVLFVYVNFLMMRDSSIGFDKISNILWTSFIDADVYKIKDDFYSFLSNYASNPNDLDEWPIIRIFEIWCR